MTSKCKLYRKMSIGTSLTDALDELVTNGSITPLLAIKILMQCKKSMNEALQTKIKSAVFFKGHLHTYRFYDNIWTFLLENATFKKDNKNLQVNLVKVIACDDLRCSGRTCYTDEFNEFTTLANRPEESFEISS
ncbi:hypothetical protein KP509_18G079100 [Ceratopteris richardii]|uniref:Transcription initiation factor IIA subunit 2 n=1 Tax=Ceratopteris richardii TaxID=49495 RepID=A0A8T2SRB0_CERRI|nr:hypothetical protein KP509_18G079100 [Ceratopteris richardii]